MNDEAEKIKELMEDLMELKRQLAVEKIRLIEGMASVEGVLKACKNPEELKIEEERIARLREEREKALNELITAGEKKIKEMKDYVRKLIEDREEDLNKLKEVEREMGTLKLA